MPPLSGIPRASASRKRSSIGIDGLAASRALCLIALEARALLDGVGELAEAVAQLDARDIELEALGHARIADGFLRASEACVAGYSVRKTP